MVSEFVCPYHGKMVDIYTGKPCHMILNYGKTYYGCCIGEDVVIKLQDTHTASVKIRPGCLPLYVFDNSSNHHKIAMDALNARKLNL